MEKAHGKKTYTVIVGESLKLFWQLAFFPVLFIPYGIFNQKVLVKWLGCGCPKIDENGNLITNAFNANSFTLIFWNVIALAVIAISFYNMRRLSKWRHRIIYVLFMGAASIFIAVKFYYLMQWN